MMYRFIIVSLSLLGLSFSSCGEDDLPEPTEEGVHYINYTLRISDSIHSYSTEQFDFDLCEDTGNSLSTSKGYRDSVILYRNHMQWPIREPIPRVLGAVISFVYWDRWETSDADQFNAFQEVMLNLNNRKTGLYFVYIDPETNKLFENAIEDYDQVLILRDPQAEETIDVSLANEYPCRIFENKLGRFNYTFSGYVYEIDGTDSVYIDRLELEAYTTIAG
ncbi:MAG: hypothetical protein AAF433_22950 [Bacteroidota bacterium]